MTKEDKGSRRCNNRGGVRLKNLKEQSGMLWTRDPVPKSPISVCSFTDVGNVYVYRVVESDALVSGSQLLGLDPCREVSL